MSLTMEQRRALSRVAHREGRNWRSRVLGAWASGCYRGVASSVDAPYLQQVRNSGGPRALRAYKPEPLASFPMEGTA